MNEFRMLLIAGHGRNTDGTWDPGAIGNGYQEATLTRELRSLIKSAADKEGILCDVAPDRNHYSYFKNGGAYDVSAYQYILEIHFNASAAVDLVGDGSIKGSMMYIDQSETGHSVEDAILEELYLLGSRQAWDGVVVTQRQYTSGLMVQNYIRGQGISHAVLETCFISDKDDMDWYQTNKVKIAEGIVRGIKKGFGLNFASYMVKVIDAALNIRSGPGTDYPVVGEIRNMGSYTIIQEQTGAGASRWGKLLSGAGWISLDYTQR